MSELQKCLELYEGIKVTEYKSIKIPVSLTDIVDKLVESEEFSSRAEYMKMLIRNDLRKRGLMQ